MKEASLFNPKKPNLKSKMNLLDILSKNTFKFLFRSLLCGCY
jgi:hypothetical protein